MKSHCLVVMNLHKPSWALAVGLSICGVVRAADDASSMQWKADRKKIIAFGWEFSCSPEEGFLKYADKFDATGLDGIGFSLELYGKDGKRVDGSPFAIDGNVEWTRDMLRKQLPDVKKALSHKGLRESFLTSIRAPVKRLDWENDAHWARVARNMGVLAWAAREVGARGLVIDPEDYQGIRQFDVKPGDKPWSVLAPIVRRRGREIFSQVFREYPDVSVLCYWLLSWHTKLIYSHDPIGSARCSGDLWPAFVNGILDVIPPTATLIDGSENAYQNKASQNEYMISEIAQQNVVHGLVAPENRAKYRQCVRAGFGVYLDSYVNDPKDEKGKDNVYYFPPERGSRLGYFQRNFAEAMRCSEGYVWFWGEKHSWLKYDKTRRMRDSQRTLWEDKLPGLSTVVRATTKPEEFFKVDFPKLFKSGRIVNIATGDPVKLSNEARFGKSGKKTAGEKGPGYFHVEDPNTLPGTQYAVVLYGHGEHFEVNAFWMRFDDPLNPPIKWRWRVPGQGIPMNDIGGGRLRGEAVVTVPEGVDCLMLQVLFHDFENDSGIDKMFVGKIPVE